MHWYHKHSNLGARSRCLEPMRGERHYDQLFSFISRLMSLCSAVGSMLCASFLLALISGSAPGAFAQVKLHSEIAPSSGNIDDLFIFTVTVEGISSGEVPTLSGGADFDLEFLGPRTSTLILNGDISSRSSFTYQLTPKREGELQTPSVELEWKGQHLSAPSITVRVGRAIAPQETPPAGANQQLGEKLLLRQSASLPSVYQGQQVVNTTMFLSRVEINGFQLEDANSDGFWLEPLVQNERSTKVIDGLEYLSVRFKDSLFPLRTGSLTLPPRKLLAGVVHRVKRRSFPGFDLFGDDLLSDLFATAETKRVTLTSEPVTIEVKPLPAPPANLASLIGPVPIVGKTSMEVDYPLQAINVGEVKNIVVTVVSSGNLNPLKTLEVTPPDGVKLYEERSEVSSDKRGGELITNKIFRYSVVPLRPGMIKVPAFRVAYFNPESASFEVARSPDVVFPVRGEAISGIEGEKDQGSTEVSPNDSVQDYPTGKSGADSRPDATQNDRQPLRYQEASFLETLAKSISTQLALLILSAVIALCLIAYIVMKLRGHSGRQHGITDAELDPIQNLKELENFVRILSAERLRGVRHDSTFDEIRALVTIKVIDPELSLAIRSLLDELEVLQYGGERAPDAFNLESLKDRVASIFRQWRR